MFNVNSQGNTFFNSFDSLSQTNKLDKTRKRSSRWDSDSDLSNEPKTPRHDSSEPKTPRHDAIEPKTPRRMNLYDSSEPKTPRRDTIEPKTPRRMNLYDSSEPKTPRRDTMEPRTPRRMNLYGDEDVIISPEINSQHRDLVYDKFELTGGDNEELDDVPWRKTKSNLSKNIFESDTFDKTAYGKWFDSDENRSKEQTKRTPAMETTFQDELLDENYPNVKPSVVDKSSFGFSSRKPVKLFMEEKNKKSEQSSQQHVFALDDSPVRSPVEHGRVLEDDDVIIVPEDMLDDMKDQSMVPKQVPPALKPLDNQRIPVLGARVKQSKMVKQQSNPALFLPPVSTSGSALFSNQSYCPPSNFVDAYPSDHNNVCSFGPPPVEPSAEFFIGTQSARPVQSVGMGSFNHFTSVPPPTRWIPSTNPTLPSPLQLAVAPPPQYPAPTNFQTQTEPSAAKSTAATTTKDAVKEEMQQQNRNLLTQKQEYVERLQLLTDEMAKLKGKKKEILEGRKTPETEQFLKENNKFQTEIQSKITAVENVIDMLSNMIAKNGGDPKIGSKNSDSRKDSPNNREPKDNNSHKFSSAKNKKVKRDRHSRSRSHSRRKTRSRSSSPKSRARSRARQRSPSKSRSRSRSRRRSKSKVRRKSLSHSPHNHHSRRSRSQDRHLQRRHTPEKRSKSISARKNKDRESSSPAPPSKTSSTAGQTKVETTIDKRREPLVVVDKREGSMKSAAECQNDKSKTSSGSTRKKIDDGSKTLKAERIELDHKIPSEANQQKQINYVYYDPETHWCRVCNVFPQTAKEYLTHLHSVEHKTEMTNCGMVDYPWHKAQPEVKSKIPADAPTERVPIRGLQFFVSATAWYCKLCNVFMGDLHCASVHLKSDQHQHNLSEFLSERPSWEDEWLKNRTKAYEEYSRKLCDSQADVFTCALPPSRETNSNVSAAPAAVPQLSHNSTGSKPVVNLVNGDSRSADSNYIHKDESKSKHADRDRERSKSKGREKFRSRGRIRSRSKSKSRERSRGRNRSKGTDRLKDSNRSRDKEQPRGRGRSRSRDRSRDSSDQRERTRHDKSTVAAFKHHEYGHSRNEPNHSKENNYKTNDNVANTKISVQADANKTANDDKFVEEWVPSVCSTGKEKEFADLRDKLRRKKDDEKNQREVEKANERSKNSKGRADVSPSEVTSSSDETRAKKTNVKSKKDQPPVKMQPIVIGKGARFPFIGKMPSKSSRKHDTNITPAKKVAEIAAAAGKKLNKLEQPSSERIEREPDSCNTIVDMDVNDVEDVPIVTEIVDDIDVRKKDFDETLKILYPEEESPQQEAASSQPAVENMDLLSFFTTSMLKTMKQLPNQKGSLDTSTMVDLVTTMSKTLLSVGQNVQNSAQLRVTSQPTLVESDAKSKRENDRVPMKKRIETSRSSPAATEHRGLTRRKNAMSQKRRRSLRKVREKLQEQEKQLQEKIDETKKNLGVESIPTPPERVIEPESIPMPAQEMETDNFTSLDEPKDDCDLMLLGIEEGDSAALKF